MTEFRIKFKQNTELDELVKVAEALAKISYKCQLNYDGEINFIKQN